MEERCGELKNTNMEEDDYDGGSMSPDVSDSSSSSLDADEDVTTEKIAELEKQVAANPYHYDPHVELINLLRKTGELQKLREARENMSKVFPLTTELWLEWLTDESRLSMAERDREAVTELFERAVKDYTSVVLWLEYAQFSIGSMGMRDGMQNVRNVFERAIMGTGLHIAQGAMIWEAYREFENALLQTLQPSSGETLPEQLEQISQQRKRVDSIFRRQLSVPLFEMDKTYEEYQEWLGDEIDNTTKQQYANARTMLDKREPYENALMSSEAPHLEEYKQYIEYEKEHGDPARVQCIYERAIVDNCLSTELWQDYTRYLDVQLKTGIIVLPTYERAIRNCPWCSTLWIRYLRAMERDNQPHEKIKELVERALQAGFTQAEEYRQLWLTYLDYLRRRVKWNDENSKESEVLRNTFIQAAEYMYQAFGNDGDPTCSIQQYWAFVEAKFFKDMGKAREVWNDIMNQGQSSKANMWLEYANLERMFGDEKHCRKVLMRGMHSTSDWPETVGEILLNFERQEGTLETFDAAMEKYDVQMKRVEERRLKAAEKEAAVLREQAIKAEMMKQSRTEQKKKQKQEKQIERKEAMKRKGREDCVKQATESKKAKVDSEGFKIPPAPIGKTPESLGSVSATGDGSNACTGVTVEHDPTKDNRTVFLSNLSYNLDEEKIREAFKDIGEITDLRLVRDYRGRSKGYCYLEFATQELAQEALNRDRIRIDGRPVFVSHCEHRKSSNTKPKFKFAQGLEKNKLFIKGLPFTTTEKELEEIYKEFGTLKEVRLVTYRNGHSKGLAYIEYEDETSASAALVKTDGMQMGEHILSVAISNPPIRKNKPQSSERQNLSSQALAQSLGSGSRHSTSGSHARTQLLLPRSLSRPAASQEMKTPSGVQNGNTQEEKKMNNADFRSMLLGK